MPRLVRYNVAASLDGCIADATGGYDWIPADETIDFAALFAKVDTLLFGRVSWELVASLPPEQRPWRDGARLVVFSRTLASVPDGVTLVRDDAAGAVAALRAEPGDGDIWLFGGGQLFGALLAAGQVDRVEVSVVPVLLGGGIPLVPPGVPRTALELVDLARYPSGIVTLSYRVRTR